MRVAGRLGAHEVLRDHARLVAPRRVQVRVGEVPLRLAQRLLHVRVHGDLDELHQRGDVRGLLDELLEHAAARGTSPLSSAASVMASMHANADSTRPPVPSARRPGARRPLRARAPAPGPAPSRCARRLPCRRRTRSSPAPAADRDRLRPSRRSDRHGRGWAVRPRRTRARADCADRRRTDRFPRRPPAAGTLRCGASPCRGRGRRP